MEIIDKRLNEITPYENNPRKNDGAVDVVANSIRNFGFKVPVVIDKNGVIVTGHTRLKAAKQLGLEEVPCLIADDLTPEQINAFRLADNKVSEFAEWDFDLLAGELEGITELDMEAFGFDEIEDVEESEGVVEDDYNAPPPEEPKSKRGDIYKLGNHRLMCGDSTSLSDVEKLMDGEKVDLVFTDPPYGISIVNTNNNVGGGGRTKSGKVGGRHIVKAKTYMSIKGDDTTETAKEFFDICVSKGMKNFIIFGGNYFTDFLKPKSCWIVWDKENTGNFADVELAWTSFDKGAKLYKWLWNGLCRKGDRKIEGKTRVHPTQKPVGLLLEILKDFTERNQNVFDGFGGSGSVLIACEQLERTCYMMEYEPKYIDVIIDRWEQFTGEKAVLLNE